jgi:hypothetical protein
MHSPYRVPQVVGALILVASIAVACSAGGSPAPSAGSSASAGSSDIYPVLVSAELVKGDNRFLFSFTDASGRPVAAPDRAVSVAFTGPGGESVPAEDGKFIWSIEDVAGVYVSYPTFPVEGDWMADFTTSTPDSPEQTIPFSFQVKADANVVVPGEDAPSVDTPTLADVGGDVSKISSDDEPDEAFYETSVADALAAKEPFVLVFATPKFCQTQACGPTLEKIKEVAADHPDVTFINVEPYLLVDEDGQLQPELDAKGNLQAAPATKAYGLLTEPYVFVVNDEGVVTASYELIFTPDEIDEAISAL